MDFCVDDALKLDYLNGLLADKERTLFEEHLAACPECRREIVELRKTATAVAGLTLPAVPGAWTAAAKERLRAKRSSALAAALPSQARARRGTSLFLYALITAGVIAGVAFLFWLVLGGTVQRWLPGLSTAALGIAEPRAARTVNLVLWILSLHALLLVPSIIDNICRIVQRGGRRERAGRSAGFFAC
jgi:predicted anti-sigma-YlaC factor YlaD